MKSLCLSLCLCLSVCLSVCLSLSYSLLFFFFNLPSHTNIKKNRVKAVSIAKGDFIYYLTYSKIKAKLGLIVIYNFIKIIYQWNSLPTNVNFSIVDSFKHSITVVTGGGPNSF